jgi:hypothetical protein
MFLNNLAFSYQLKITVASPFVGTLSGCELNIMLKQVLEDSRIFRRTALRRSDGEPEFVPNRVSSSWHQLKSRTERLSTTWYGRSRCLHSVSSFHRSIRAEHYGLCPAQRHGDLALDLGVDPRRACRSGSRRRCPVSSATFTLGLGRRRTRRPDGRIPGLRREGLRLWAYKCSLQLIRHGNSVFLSASWPFQRNVPNRLCRACGYIITSCSCLTRTRWCPAGLHHAPTCHWKRPVNCPIWKAT